VLSPGFTSSRSTLTALAEDLASHGYVVAGIDHTYESFATAFPDGRVTTCLARQARQRGTGSQEKVAAGRAADVSFVLGELTGTDRAWPGAGLIDPSRIAMAGHSAGGAAAIAAMLADSRIHAGIDMDGATAAPIPDPGLSRPFLFLGKQSNYTPGKQSPGIPGKPGPVSTWERDWKLLTGWKRWLLVSGAVHASFTDLALLADQIGIDIGAALPGARSLDITRAYVLAFFDQHLRSTPQALLDQPSPRYPEVTFCSPDLNQAGGDERPLVDLADDLLLAGVVLHDVLAARVGRGRGLALRGGVPVAVTGGAPQPVTEDPVPDRLGAVEPENMQIAARLIRHQSPVAVPPGLADHQPEPDLFQRRHVVLLAPGIGHRQVDVDDGLGRQPRY
jgi:Platelet-activating factor acetylhydrolase, isoform II